MILECSNRFRRTFFRRIQEADEADQHHGRFIFNTEAAAARHIVLLSDCQHPQTIVIVVFIGLHRLTPCFFIQWQYLSIEFNPRDDIQDLFNGAFGDKLALPALIFQDDTHPPAYKVKRNLVNPLIAVKVSCQPLLISSLNNRMVNQVLKAGLKVTVEIRVAQNSGIIMAIDIHVSFQHNLVFSECPGFVSTEHIHLAEGLNGAQRAHDDLMFGHGHSAARQG